MAKKMDRDDFEEATMWWIDCPKCGDAIEITEHPIDMDGVYCEGCKTYFELEE